MLNLDPVKTQAVAHQTRSAFAAFDVALVDATRLTGAFLDAAMDSGLTAGESQRILQRIHDSTSKLLEGRSDMLRATAMLTRCIEHSQISASEVGCPLGMAGEETPAAKPNLTLVA